MFNLFMLQNACPINNSGHSLDVYFHDFENESILMHAYGTNMENPHIIVDGVINNDVKYTIYVSDDEWASLMSTDLYLDFTVSSDTDIEVKLTTTLGNEYNMGPYSCPANTLSQFIFDYINDSDAENARIDVYKR